MDTPFAATVHKKNVHVGGGKTFTMRKPIKLKLSGKRRKPLADFRDTYAPSSGVSNDVDLKPMAHGKQQIERAGLIPVKWGMSDEVFKKCHEWALEQDLDEMDCSTWPILEDEESHYCRPPLIELIHLSEDLGLHSHMSHKIEDPDLHSLMSYKIEDPDLHSPMSSPGARFYTPEELDDFFAEARRVVQNKYPLPKMKFEDVFGLDNDN